MDVLLGASATPLLISCMGCCESLKIVAPLCSLRFILGRDHGYLVGTGLVSIE